MPRDIPIGNGNILIAFNKDAALREFYFPHVGEENHIKKDPFRMGVWVNGVFTWLPEGWRVTRAYLDDSLVTDVSFFHEKKQLRITVNDLVDFHDNIYLKRVSIENLSDKEMEIRIFFGQDFSILDHTIGDTAAYRPDVKALLHYKRDRYFLINVFANKTFGVDNFATGNKDHDHKTGTWKDAEDGILGGNPIAQGSVDSVVGVTLKVSPSEKESFFYWICAGKDWEEVSVLNAGIIRKRPEAIFKRTLDYWKLWVDKEGLNYQLLPHRIAWLYKKSLLIVRTQIDNGGSIIAANDSDVVYFNRDTYSYMWPRDAALVSYALDLAGYPEITTRFFNLCCRIIQKDGYFMHKYTSSGMLASSWHPWQKDKKLQLPIQEDETALILWALWEHFTLFKDIEFIKPLYKPLIKGAADFMMNYRDGQTGLPLPSYDLWEERQGVLTFTASAVYGGLRAAANFSRAFGDIELADEYDGGARKLRQAMDKYLYLEKEKRFARMVNFRKDGGVDVDATVDASLYGVFAFGAYDPNDEKVKNTMDQVYEKLWCRTPAGGLARYEDDPYYRTGNDVPGNPWFVTTLWLAQYYIAVARTRGELDRALPILAWACDHALPSGVMAEQINPYSNEPLSVSPLTWSHATYMAAVQEYLKKLIQVEKCPACDQPKYAKLNISRMSAFLDPTRLPCSM